MLEDGGRDKSFAVEETGTGIDGQAGIVRLREYMGLIGRYRCRIRHTETPQRTVRRLDFNEITGLDIDKPSEQIRPVVAVEHAVSHLAGKRS